MKWKPNNILDRMIKMQKSDREAYSYYANMGILLGMALGLNIALIAVIFVKYIEKFL